MAKLEKLEVCGIRSFSPNAEERLKFSSPLTIILGQNGCGKTTIIESILYSLTGNTPAGTTQGQGFVNDPKMSSSYSSKGAVKLTFTDKSKNQVTVQRVMELTTTTQKKLKFANKPPALKIVKPDGEEVNLSSRCVAITEECCRLINVGPTILENVIFCHQENSDWPLDERQKLKIKFDQIFETEKFNACLVVLKKYVKDLKGKMKIVEIDLSHKKKHKIRIEEEQRKLTQKRNDIIEKQDAIDAKSRDKEPMTKKIEEICDLENDLSKLVNDLGGKKATKQSLSEQQQNILANIESDFDGTDEELSNKIQHFETKRQEEQDKIAAYEQKIDNISTREKQCALEVEKEQEQLILYKNRIEQHQQKCAQLLEILKKIKVAMSLKIAVDSQASQSEEVLPELRAAIAKYEREFNDLATRTDKESQKMQKEVDEARKKDFVAKQALETKQQKICERETTLQKISIELQSVSSIDTTYAEVVAKLESFDKILATLNSKLNENEEQDQIVQIQNEIVTNEQLFEKYERDHRILQQNDTVLGKLESENQIVSQKQRNVDQLRAKHLKSLKQLFNERIPENKLKDSVTLIHQKENNKVKQLSDEAAKLEKTIQRLEYEKLTTEEKIKADEEKLRQKKAKIAEACAGKDFDATLEEIYKQKEKLQRDKGQFSSITVIYGEFLKEFEKDAPCCPVCETNFNSRTSAVKQIISAIKSKLQGVPKLLKTTEQEMAKVEKRYESLLQLSPVKEEIETLKSTGIPLMQQQLAKIDESRAGQTSELEALKARLTKPQKLVEICTLIMPDMSSIDQNHADLEVARKNVANLNDKLVKIVSNKSKFEIEAELDALKSNINELRRKVESKRTTIKNHQDRVRQIIEEKSRCQQKQAEMREMVLKRPMLEEQKAQLTAEIESLQDEVFESAAIISEVEQELEAVALKKADSDRRNKAVLEAERTKLFANRQAVKDFEKLYEQILEFANDNVEERKSELERKVARLREQSLKLKEVVEQLRKTIVNITQMWTKEELQLRNFNDTVLYREKKALERAIDADIARLEKRIGDYNYRTIQREKQSLLERCEALEREVNIIVGQKSALSNEIRELEAQLSLPANKGAYKDYMHAVYELLVQETLYNSIMGYVPKLEAAIVKFHRFKMIQINKKIRELWRDIYRGNDVDYIEIKTTEVTTVKGGYEYKVVQYKNGQEMDMRGRCSAGQKVLACLIIRIALAEALSGHCGILTLDEPTTNLDRENIMSLSDTLARIVQSRQKEANFQLVVITHDEEFIQILNRNLGVSSFYRISRNQKGFSQITRERIP